MPEIPDPLVHDSVLRRAFEAVRHGDRSAVGAALAVTPALVAARNEDGATLLSVAATATTTDHADGPTAGAAQLIDVVRMLIDAGVDQSAGDGRGWTPLHSAGIAGHIVLARLLSRLAPTAASAPSGRPARHRWRSACSTATSTVAKCCSAPSAVAPPTISASPARSPTCPGSTRGWVLAG